jgi:hypothetical protein
MKYLPHTAAFTFFALLGLSMAGVFPFVMFARAIGAMICLVVCVLIAEAAVLTRAVKPPAEKRYVTAVAQTMLRKGEICTVDVLHRTIERVTVS